MDALLRTSSASSDALRQSGNSVLLAPLQKLIGDCASVVGAIRAARLSSRGAAAHASVARAGELEGDARAARSHREKCAVLLSAALNSSLALEQARGAAPEPRARDARPLSSQQGLTRFAPARGFAPGVRDTGGDGQHDDSAAAAGGVGAPRRAAARGRARQALRQARVASPRRAAPPPRCAAAPPAALVCTRGQSRRAFCRAQPARLTRPPQLPRARQGGQRGVREGHRVQVRRGAFFVQSPRSPRHRPPLTRAAPFRCAARSRRRRATCGTWRGPRGARGRARSPVAGSTAAAGRPWRPPRRRWWWRAPTGTRRSCGGRWAASSARTT